MEVSDKMNLKQILESAFYVAALSGLMLIFMGVLA